MAARERAARRERFGVSDLGSIADSVPHALGYALEACWYDELTHGRRFESLATTQRDWVPATTLGARRSSSERALPFTTASSTRWPTSPARWTFAARLARRRGGRAQRRSQLPRIGAPRRLPPLPEQRRRSIRPFNGQGARYWDSAIAAPSTEPTDDYIALVLAAFAQEASGAGK